MKPSTFSKSKSKSKPAVANPKSKPAVANPKGKPTNSITDTDNSPGDFYYLTHKRSCVDMFLNKNNVNARNGGTIFDMVFNFHLNTNYYCSICTIDASAQDNYCTKYSTIDIPRRYLNEFLLLIDVYKNRPFIFKIDGIDKIFAATLIDLMRSKKIGTTFQTLSKKELDDELAKQEDACIKEVNIFCNKYKTNLPNVLNDVANTFKLDLNTTPKVIYSSTEVKQIYTSEFNPLEKSCIGYVILNDRLQQSCSDIAQIIYNLQNNKLTDNEFKSCINDFFKFAFLFNGLKSMIYIDKIIDEKKVNLILKNRSYYVDLLKNSKSPMFIDGMFNMSRRIVLCDKQIPHYSKLKEDRYIGIEYMKRLIFNVLYICYRLSIMDRIYNILDKNEKKERNYDFKAIQQFCIEFINSKDKFNVSEYEQYKKDLIKYESLLNVDFKINGFTEKDCMRYKLDWLYWNIRKMYKKIRYDNPYFEHLDEITISYIDYIYDTESGLFSDLVPLFIEGKSKDESDLDKLLNPSQNNELTNFKYDVPAQDNSVGLVRAEEIINNIVDSYLFKSK